MTVAQWTFYAIVPMALSVAAVFYGEIFRRRQLAASRNETDLRVTPVEPMTSETAAELDPLHQAIPIAAWLRQRDLIKRSDNRRHDLIGNLRNIYGDTFAAGFPADAKLVDVLFRLDDQSLGQLIRDHEAGKLEDVLSGSAVAEPTREQSKP